MDLSKVCDVPHGCFILLANDAGKIFGVGVIGQ